MFHPPSPGWSKRPCSDRSSRHRGTDPRQNTSPGSLPCRLLPRTCRSACRRSRRCTKFHPASPGWSKRPLSDRSSRHRGTDPRQNTSPGSLPCTFPKGTCRSACRRSHRCMKSHPPSPGLSKRPLPDHNSRHRGTDPRQNTSPGSLPCTSLKGTCRSACTRSHRCTMFHPPSPGWSKRPCSDRSSRHRGTDPRQSTSPGSHPCMPPTRTCRSACTRSHRCRMSHRPSPGLSKRPLPDRSFRPRDTDPRQNTSPGSHQCRFRPRTCRSACRHCRRCTKFHQPSLGWNKRPRSDRSSRHRGTDPRQNTSPGSLPCRSPPRTCRSACRRSHRCTMFHPPSPGWSKRPCSDRSFPPRGTGPRQNTSPGWPQCRSPTRTCRSACRRSRRCTSSRRLSLGSNKRPLSGHSSQLRGTGPTRSTSPGSYPCRSLPRTCRSACRHCRRCTKFHQPSLGWNKRPCSDRSSRHRGTDPRQNTSPGSHPCRFLPRTCRSECTRSHRCMSSRRLSLGSNKRPSSDHSSQPRGTDPRQNM